jgi:GDPmannose 4,6-dehydratase
MKKTAIIVGSAGQDGKIACEQLAKKGFNVIGIDKQAGLPGALKNFTKSLTDIENTKEVFGLIKKVRPDEIYYFAAFHHSSQDKLIDNIELLDKSYKVNVLSLLNFLEGIRRFSPKSRLFYAASSLVFGDTDKKNQSEATKFSPDSMYGITKLDGLYLCRMYRKKYGVFASVGILYNHESAYRGNQFLSKKVITTAIDIKKKKKKNLILGDLEARVDWGYAPDYVDAMQRILQLKKSDDFIIATGKTHSVRDFVKTAFSYQGLDWKKYVKEEKQSITRNRKSLAGDARKLKKMTGWKPSVGFEGMIRKITKKCDG